MPFPIENDENVSVENTSRVNRYGAEDVGSLIPLLIAYRIKAMNDIGDKIKDEAGNLIKAENDADFSRKLKIIIQKHYDPIKEQLILPPEVIEMLQQMREDEEYESILDEIGFHPTKSVYSAEERHGLSDASTQVLQRLGKKLDHLCQKCQELNTFRLEVMQLLSSATKKQDEATKIFARGVRGAH